MNESHLELLLSHFGIGTAVTTPKRIYGGLLHKMYHVETNKGAYAVKELSKDIDLSNESIVKNYELKENISEVFLKKDINAVPAISASKKHMLITDGTGYLIYPWVNAKALESDKVNPDYACKIAKIIYKMHELNIRIPELSDAVFDFHEDDAILESINLAKIRSPEIFNILDKNLNAILKANREYNYSINLLKSKTVVSHGDLDQKNVLWDNDAMPYLIDWESARKLNPIYEIINAALDWSGIIKKFNENIFFAMIEAYKNGKDLFNLQNLEAAFNGVLGNWINWLVYNIKRSFSEKDLEQRALGIEQVNQTIPIILNIQLLAPELINKVLS